MNGDLNVFRDLLVETILGQFGDENGRHYALLKEDSPGARLRSIKIYDVPKNAVLIHIDRADQPKTLFRGEKGQRQRCDYVLVTTYKNSGLMLFIEIKSSGVRDVEVKRQFRGAECIMDYCNVTLNRFHGQTDLLSNYQKRFVVFYKPPIPKRNTRPKIPNRKNDKPDKAFKYPDPHNPSLSRLVVL